MSTITTKTRHRRPATAEELLDHEEALAIQRIAGSVQRLGDDVLVATDLRGRIRRHPFLAVGIGAFSGFVGGPLLLGTLERVMTMTAGIPNLPSVRPRALSGLVWARLRGIRTRQGRAQ
jgi:hypothetical protein